MHANPSNCCHNLLLQMVILTEVRHLHFSLKLKDILPKKVSSDFSYTLTYLTLKYERNRIFHSCRVMFDFYRQALLNAKEADSEAFKETSFSKATMVMRFPAKKNAGCPKAPCDFPPRKDGILCPRRVVLGLPSPSHRVCGRMDGRMYGCTDGRTDGHVTITSQPKFLRLIGYHISLAMELRYKSHHEMFNRCSQGEEKY